MIDDYGRVTARSHTPITKHLLTVQEVTDLSLVTLPIYLSQDLRFPALVILTLQSLLSEGIKLDSKPASKRRNLCILFKDCSTEASKFLIVTR